MLPIVLIGGGVIMGLIGIWAKIDAEEMIEKSKKMLVDARKRLKIAVEDYNAALNELYGEYSAFQSYLENLRNLSLELKVELKTYEIEQKIDNYIKEVDSTIYKVLNEVKNLSIGSFAGVLGSSLIYGSAIAFGTASTGTPIAILSGVAQKNAALAFLGGGAKAVGGLGIAGGVISLFAAGSGIGIGVYGIISNLEAEKNLTKVTKLVAKVDAEIRNLECQINSMKELTIKLRIINNFHNKVLEILKRTKNQRLIEIYKNMISNLLDQNIFKLSIGKIEQIFKNLLRKFEENNS